MNRKINLILTIEDRQQCILWGMKNFKKQAADGRIPEKLISPLVEKTGACH